MALIPTTVILVAVFHHASSARSSGEDDTQRSASDKNRPVTEATEAIVPQRLPSVVGTLELSFTRATRTHFLTLNAPAVSGSTPPRMFSGGEKKRKKKEKPESTAVLLHWRGLCN